MKFIIIRCLIIAGLLIHLSSSPALSAPERRIALVIGNGAYKSAPLRNPVNDASDIADALGKLGFSVSLKTNADQRNMKQAIRAFGKQLQKGGVGLFYFAGHGVQVRGSNYLIPIGAEIETEPDVEYEAVDAGRVLAQMEDAGNSLNIIILDACRANPFARSFRSSSRGLAKMDAPTGSILAYATAPGSIASDGPGRNGLYTSAFLKHVMTPGLEIGKLFRQVRIDVVNESGKKQVPWESSSLTGDFYFNTDRGITVVKHPKPESPKLPQGVVDKEMLFWQSIQNSDNPVLFESYLKKFPNGTFTDIAKVKIYELEKKKQQDTKKETPKVALTQPSAPKPKVIQEIQPKHIQADPQGKTIAKDGQFIKYDNGIVHDTKTDLEWIAGPDSKTIWKTAKSWVANLTVDGGGWRMPTIDELRTLYQKGKGTRNRTSLLKTTGWQIWSGETKSTMGYSSTYAWYFDYRAVTRVWGTRGLFWNRAFAVRSRKTESKQSNQTQEAPKYAAISPDVTKPKIVARDGHYEKHANGIVKDTRTGLEWYVGPDKDTTWDEAKRLVDSLSVDGGGWRMPTGEELKPLYQKSVGPRDRSALFEATGFFVWSGETRDSSSASTFAFYSGGRIGWVDRGSSRNTRVFAVRSR